MFWARAMRAHFITLQEIDMKYDPLGDFAKALEAKADPDPFDPEKPICARVDGRGFSKFTRGMRKPFDPHMMAAMRQTAEALLHDTAAQAAYVQSDEISLIWAPSGEDTAFFGGRPTKTASVLAGLATARFFQALAQTPHQHRLDAAPHFDGRAFQPASQDDAARIFAWRGIDAWRNAIQGLAQAHFPARELHGVPIAKQIDMIERAGVSLADQPPAGLHGVLLRKETQLRTLNEAERKAIPARHRPAPDRAFERSVVCPFDAAHPGQIRNLTDWIWNDAAPDFI